MLSCLCGVWFPVMPSLFLITSFSWFSFHFSTTGFISNFYKALELYYRAEMFRQSMLLKGSIILLLGVPRKILLNSWKPSQSCDHNTTFSKNKKCIDLESHPSHVLYSIREVVIRVVINSPNENPIRCFCKMSKIPEQVFVSIGTRLHVRKANQFALSIRYYTTTPIIDHSEPCTCPPIVRKSSTFLLIVHANDEEIEKLLP